MEEQAIEWEGIRKTLLSCTAESQYLILKQGGIMTGSLNFEYASYWAKNGNTVFQNSTHFQLFLAPKLTVFWTFRLWVTEKIIVEKTAKPSCYAKCQCKRVAQPFTEKKKFNAL